MQQAVKKVGTEIKSTPSNLMLSTYFGQMYTNQVSVPVQISNSRFLLDFKESLKSITEEADILSDEMMKTTLYILVQSYDRLNVDETVNKLISMGIKVSASAIPENQDERTVIANFCQRIQERITSLSVESGLSNLLIQDVLTARGDSLNLATLGGVSFSKVEGVVDWAQEFYSLFVRQERGDQLTQMLATRSATNPILIGGRALYALFRSGTGAYVQARENYVMDELFTDMMGEKLVTTKTLLDSKMYRVTDTVLPDIQFVDAIAGYIWSLNTLQGIVSDLGDGDSLPVSSLVDQIITGIGDKVPFLPKEAGDVDKNKLEEHYKVIYLLHLTRRFMTDNPGDFRNRVVNSIQGNRFFKAEGMEKLFNEELYILSACFEAFRDTAFYYRDLYRNQQILFSDWKELNPLKRKQLTKFMEEFVLGSATSFTYGLEHPAFYKQPGHLTTHTASSLSASLLNVEVHIPKSSWSNSFHYIMGVEDETFLRIGTSGLLSGGWWDIPSTELPYGRRLLNRAHIISPQYTFKVNLPDTLLTSGVIKQMYSIYPKNAPQLQALLDTDPDVYDMIRMMAQERRFLRVTDLSLAMRLPLEIAEIIWERAGDVKEFLDLSELNGLTFFIDPDLAPYYEYRELSQERYVAPFVGKYPLLVEEIDRAFIIESLPDLPSLEVSPAPKPQIPVAVREIPSTSANDAPAADVSGADGATE